MKHIHSRLVTFLIAFAVWLLLSFSLDWQTVVLGCFIALVVAAMMGDMFAEKALKWFDLKRHTWFVWFIVVFWWECLRSNIDVALRVLNPRLPINPGIVKVKTNLKTETGLTLLANSITLTPGTFTVDIDREQGYLYIHWIDVKTQDVDQASKIIVSKFERILREVFE
ncbi:MAG: Na+/H+ antiporter subunit E [Candidatus Omnitrophica bacterium]|nr:Na+/H+ antiporter subunit E [Candidatus Omnitrophota bacterium]